MFPPFPVTLLDHCINTPNLGVKNIIICRGGAWCKWRENTTECIGYVTFYFSKYVGNFVIPLFCYRVYPIGKFHQLKMIGWTVVTKKKKKTWANVHMHVYSIHNQSPKSALRSPKMGTGENEDIFIKNDHSLEYLAHWVYIDKEPSPPL